MVKYTKPVYETPKSYNLKQTSTAYSNGFFIIRRNVYDVKKEVVKIFKILSFIYCKKTIVMI